MIIKSVSLENWKCFSEEINLDFSTIEIFSFKNGSGKTSVLEAIHYGIWGKTDYKMSTYQNHGGATKVSVSFDIDGVDYKVEREFPNTKAVMFKDGEKFKEGISEIFEYMNSIMDYNVAKRLWFKGEISEAPILDFNFFKKEILAEKLKEPIALQQHYTHQANMLNRELKTLNYKPCREPEVIQKEIDELSDALKSHTDNVSNSKYIKACQVQKAAEQLKEIKVYFSENNVQPVTNNEIFKWKNINADTIKSQLDAEKKKVMDDTLSKINGNALKIIYDYSKQNGKCMICDNTLSEDKEKHIDSLLKAGVRDINLESTLEEKLKYKESLSEELIKQSESLIKLTNEVKAMPNYQEVIDNYNSENEKMWETFDALNQEKEIAIRSKDTLERINELDKKIKDCKEKRDFVKNYLDKATESLTVSLFNESTKILNNLNDDYSEISISPDDNSIQVVVRGKQLSLNQLSRGEKTMVALALIYTIRDIFCPGIPLIFDESFSGLSKNNNDQVIDFIKDSYEQLFIISHNQDWIDYPNYGSNVNVRTEWN